MTFVTSFVRLGRTVINELGALHLQHSVTLGVNGMDDAPSLLFDDATSQPRQAIHVGSLGTIVANKKSRTFAPSDEMRMENVDKDAVNTKISLFCYLDS